MHSKPLLPSLAAAGSCALTLLLILILAVPEALPQSLSIKRRTLLESINVPLDPRLFGISAWRVGESSKYKVTRLRPGYSEMFYLTFSILAVELPDSPSLYWLETQMQPQNSERETVVNRVQRPFGDLSLFALGAVGDVLTQVGENTPVSIPVSALRPYLQSPQNKAQDHHWVAASRVEEEDTRVGAGVFKTSKARFQDRGDVVEVWFTTRVGPVGIVRASKRDLAIELLSYIPKGSVSAIYGTPVSMPQLAK